MSGHSFGFVVIETTRREGEPDNAAVCWVLPGTQATLVPDEETASRERDRLAAHAAIDADLNVGAAFSYSVAEVISRD